MTVRVKLNKIRIQTSLTQMDDDQLMEYGKEVLKKFRLRKELEWLNQNKIPWKLKPKLCDLEVVFNPDGRLAWDPVFDVSIEFETVEDAVAFRIGCL